MTTREQIYVLETIKAMKKKIARDAIGKGCSTSFTRRVTRLRTSICQLTSVLSV